MNDKISFSTTINGPKKVKKLKKLMKQQSIQDENREYQRNIEDLSNLN